MADTVMLVEHGCDAIKPEAVEPELIDPPVRVPTSHIRYRYVTDTLHKKEAVEPDLIDPRERISTLHIYYTPVTSPYMRVVTGTYQTGNSLPAALAEEEARFRVEGGSLV
jgi:hypothetical protein